jgi:general stress protein 26
VTVEGPGLSDQVLGLLSGRRIGSLGTVNPDGSVHLTAVWYVLEGSHLLIPTFSASRKVSNVEAGGTATLMVDARSVRSMRGVSISGQASVLRGEAAKAVNHRIHERYLTDAALEDPVIGPLFAEGDDVTIRIACESASYWDMGVAPLEPLFAIDEYLRPLEE